MDILDRSIAVVVCVEYLHQGFQLTGLLQHDPSNCCSVGSERTWGKEEVTLEFGIRLCTRTGADLATRMLSLKAAC